MKTVSLTTQDGVEITFDEYCVGKEKALVICHGIYQSKNSRIFRQIAEEFCDEYDVINMDLRGHGESGGGSTLTALEPLDVKAVVDYAREFHKKVGLLGFSLGAASSILALAEYKAIDSLTVVSPFASLKEVEMKLWRKEAVETLFRKIEDYKDGDRDFWVRFGNPFLEKKAPIEVIDEVSPIPILFIHGEKDWVIDPSHSQRLYEKAGQLKEIVIFKDGGHAEHIYEDHPEKFITTIKDWLGKTLNQYTPQG